MQSARDLMVWIIQYVRMTEGAVVKIQLDIPLCTYKLRVILQTKVERPMQSSWDIVCATVDRSASEWWSMRSLPLNLVKDEARRVALFGSGIVLLHRCRLEYYSILCSSSTECHVLSYSKSFSRRYRLRLI